MKEVQVPRVLTRMHAHTHNPASPRVLMTRGGETANFSFLSCRPMISNNQDFGKQMLK